MFELDRERVLKAFRDMAPAGFPEADPTVIPRVVFSAELSLFERIQSHRQLEVFLPRFFHIADPRQYDLDSLGSYSSGCGLVMERISGEDVKLFEVPDNYREAVDRVVEEIKETTGANDPWDGSCFIPGSRAAFTLIDIATPTDRLHFVDQLMHRDGKVSEEALAALGVRVSDRGAP